MLYRVLARLEIRNEYVEPGSVDKLKELSPRVIGILLEKRRIVPVQAPPLAEFPGWTLRAERLGEAGIGAIAFLEKSDESIGEAIDADPRAIAKWRCELRNLLGIGKATRRRS